MICRKLREMKHAKKQININMIYRMCTIFFDKNMLNININQYHEDWRSAPFKKKENMQETM